MNNLVIPVDGNLNSLLAIGSDWFPMGLYHDDLKNYSNGFVNWHKQRQIEISVVEEGAVTLQVLEREETIPAGDGFVVLPGRLHTVKPAGNQPARYSTLIFDPALLIGFKGSFFDEAYYSSLALDSFYRFSSQDGWAEPVFRGFQEICQGWREPEPAFCLWVQRSLQDMWILLADQLFSQRPAAYSRRDNRRIHQMIEYLHQHYSEKFSLSSMAASVSVSRGECSRFFKKMMHMTISDYLLEYRMAKALELLEEGEKSVTEISQAVGFGSVSYFISSFRQKVGCSPLAYKKRGGNAKSSPFE